MIAFSTLHAPPFYFPFVPDFLSDKLTLLLLTPQLSSSQLYSLVQPTLLSLTLTSVIMFLLLELGSDEVHVEELLFPFGWIGAEVFVVSHGLAEARGNTVQDDVDEVMVSQLGVDIESIDIVQGFLDSTCLFEITDLIKRSVRHIAVAIAFPNSIRDLFINI